MEHQDITKDLGRLQRNSLVVGLIGAAVAGYGYMVARDGFFQSWLMGFLYWFLIAAGSLGMLLIHHLTAGRWSFMIQRCLEAAAKTMPLLFILFIPIILGMTNLYEWARPEAAHDEVIQAKALYLNVNGFIGRAALFFVIWSFLAYRLSALSNRQDQETDTTKTNQQLRTMSGPGLVLFVLASTFATIDWGMSLTPHWFSTMYGPLWLAFEGIASLSFMAIIANKIGHRKPVGHYMNHQYFHDIGNLMFAFTILFTYMAIGEYIIIWSGNLAEETEWFLERQGDWNWIALTVAVCQFAIPFLLMLNKPVKRHGSILSKVALWVLGICYVSMHWLIAPTFRHRPELTWVDIACWVGIGGLWLAAFFGFLKSKPLLPLGDPRFKEKFAEPEVQ